MENELILHTAHKRLMYNSKKNKIAYSMIGFDVKKNSGLGEMSGEIIRLMKNNPRITIPQLAEILATTTRTVERWIKALKLNNKIARQGSTKSGVWVVTIV